jgi:hypothetical protein
MKWKKNYENKRNNVFHLMYTLYLSLKNEMKPHYNKIRSSNIILEKKINT